MWKKKQRQCLPEELEVGDCWIALSLTQLNGLILAGRVGKHTDELAEELVHSTQAKTNCKEWHTHGWGGYKQVFDREVKHYISKALTQRYFAEAQFRTLLNQSCNELGISP